MDSEYRDAVNQGSIDQSPSRAESDQGRNRVDGKLPGVVRPGVSDEELAEDINEYTNEVNLLVDDYDENLGDPVAEEALREKLKNSEEYKSAILEKFNRQQTRDEG